MRAADIGGTGSLRRSTPRASDDFTYKFVDDDTSVAIEKFHHAMKKGSKMSSPKLYLWICLLAMALIILICTGLDSVDSGFLSLEKLKPALYTGDSLSARQEEFQERPKDICQGKRVYMYELPSRFNVDFSLNKTMCKDGLMAWLDLCSRFEHGGYGTRFLNETQYEGQWDKDWYDTDSYMLEVIFHNRMQSYKCRTLDPSRADAFFIPYYTGIDALRLLYEKADLSDTMDKRANFGTEIVDWMDRNAHQWWHKYQGRDHFMLFGRTTWDFRVQKYWGTGFVDRPYIYNTTNLMMEREPTTENEQAIPYPTSFHPSSPERLWSWIRGVQETQRKYLFAYVGAPRPELDWSVRGILSSQCTKAGNKSCHMVDCSQIVCSHNPIAIYKAFLKSTFCLQPRGDSSTRRSTFDCLIAGSIPVFFHADSAYTQYTWHLPRDSSSYSVFISEDDLKAGVSIQKVLRGYSPDRIRRMQKIIQALIPNLLYVDYSNDIKSGHKDAFELSIQKVVEKTIDYKHMLEQS